MTVPPKLWRCLVREWVPLDPALSWSLWHALGHARWSLAREWLAAFLAFDPPGARRSAEEVETFFGQVATSQVLLGLLAALQQEGVLMKRDGRRLEDALLAQMTAEGAWKHEKGVRHG